MVNKVNVIVNIFLHIFFSSRSIAVLVRCGSSVTAEDDEGRTPLYLALLYGCVSAAKALLSFPQNIEHSTKVCFCVLFSCKIKCKASKV